MYIKNIKVIAVGIKAIMNITVNLIIMNTTVIKAIKDINMIMDSMVINIIRTSWLSPASQTLLRSRQSWASW